MTSLPKTYKALFFDNKGAELVLRDVELKQPGPGYVLVKVVACGVCHSDRFVQQGNFGDVYPRVPGHEAVGDVVAGMFQICDNEQVNGVSMDGGYAEYVLLRAEATVRVPVDANPAEVAPFLCAGVTVFNAMRNAGVRQGGIVAVQGLGGLGHLALQYASKMGYTVVAISHGADKQDFAEQLGAHHYINTSSEDAADALQKLGGANMIVATAPNGKAVSPLVAGLAPLGKLLVLAPLGPVEFDTKTMVIKGLSVNGWNSGHHQDSEDAIAFAQLHGVKCMIETFPFMTDYKRAFDKMADGKVRFRSVMTF
ncbi:hypothetical protein ACHAP5_008816 [Fusarium lateritium]